MTKRWLDTTTDADVAKQANEFWAALRDGLDTGAFWADRIKQYRNEPGKRLHMAMANLPLPAAFREAAIAMRAIIRAKRKAGDAHEQELSLLYWLAAIESFMVPYAERMKEPGYNVFSSIPGERLRSLPFEYRTLGYEQLALLNKTDKKWLVEAWGEPEAHTTLNEMHRSLWDEYEDKLIKKRDSEAAAFGAELQSLVHGSNDCGNAPRNVGRQKAGCTGVVVIVLTGFVTLLIGRLLVGGMT